jgi:hypothetical protein
MAEVAAVATIVQLVDFGGKILAAGYTFLAKIARAPTEIRMLLSDVANVNALLSQIQSLTSGVADTNASTALNSLTSPGALKTCDELLISVEKDLESCRQAEGHPLKNIGKALKWPIIERERKDTMQQLRVLQDELTSAITMVTMDSA